MSVDKYYIYVNAFWSGFDNKTDANHIGFFEYYNYTELDEFYLYEFRYEADRILWSDELFDLKERLNEIPNMEPLACLGVGTSEDAFPILTIEFWKEK